MGRDAIVKTIQAALEHEPHINLHRYPMHVEHDADGTLRLTGTVSDIRAKRLALRLAREAGGTQAVVDDLRLDVGDGRGEKELRQAVVATLTQEPAFAEMLIVEGDAPPEEQERDAIAVAVDGERVRLHGHVRGLSRRRLAEVLTWWVAGVGDVVNGIRVEPAEKDSDGALADAVQVVLEKDPSIPGRQLDITVRSGVVRLAGAVDNEEQRRLAVLDCWYIPGVHGVEDALSVKNP